MCRKRRVSGKANRCAGMGVNAHAGPKEGTREPEWVREMAISSLPALLITKMLVLLGDPRPPALQNSPDIGVL